MRESLVSSYASNTCGFFASVREAASLYHLHSRNIAARIRAAIEDARRVEARIREAFGVEIHDLDVLEVGPGQFPTQLMYFATRNRVLGADRDLILLHGEPAAYLKMLKTNGIRRTVKTLGRKLLGIDHRYARHLARQLHVNQLPKLTIHLTDASRLAFPASSFDFIYSRAVLHHLHDPKSAVDELVRVLRPGGIAYVTIHPYTSATGCLDPRIHSKRQPEVAGWPHLRPQLHHRLHAPNAYLNRLRIEDWRRLFTGKMPGVKCVVTPNDETAIVDEANRLHERGDLLDYSIEELTAGELAALWMKPSMNSRAESRALA